MGVKMSDEALDAGWPCGRSARGGASSRTRRAAVLAGRGLRQRGLVQGGEELDDCESGC